jgi:hypothetical protein
LRDWTLNRGATQIRGDVGLTDILVPGLNLQDLVEDIREKATRRFEAIRSPYKHLAIIGSFWARPITGSGFSGDCLISNYYEVRQPGSRLVPSSVASNQFQAWISLNSTSSPYSLFSAGQPLSEYQIRRLKRFIGRYIRNTTAEERSHGANGLCRHLAEFIRSFANSNSAVGKSLMQTILPNPRAPGVSHSSATFTYLPADSNSHVTFAPNLVNATMRIKGVKLSRFPVSGR